MKESDLSQAVRKLANAWFEPKGFEENPMFYERFGIRAFEKYMPTGDLFNRYVWKPLLKTDWVKPGDLNSLKTAEFFTRAIEATHMLGFMLFNSVLIYQLSEGKYSSAAPSVILNVLINVYPIMLQRYNRSRLTRTIRKMESIRGDSEQ